MGEQARSALSGDLPTVDKIGVAVCSCGHRQRHVGLVYLDNSNELRLLGLSLDRLANDPWDPSKYLVFVPDLVPNEMDYVRGRAKVMWEANGKYVPYGFSDPRECFDEYSAKFLFGSKIGLTCATFVLAVFEFCSVRLIDYESWQQRDDDIEWQTYIIDFKERRWAKEPDITIQRRAEIGNLRYRPEEVAAAADMFPPSVTFELAKDRGEAIVADLASMNASSPPS